MKWKPKSNYEKLAYAQANQNWEEFNQLIKENNISLETEIKEKDPGKRARILFVLGNLRELKHFNLFVEHRLDEDIRVRYEAVAALGKFDVADTEEYLLDSLYDSNFIIQQKVISIFEENNYSQIVPSIEEFFISDKCAIKRNVAEFLGKFKLPSSLGFLKKEFNKDSSYGKDTILQAIGEYPAEDIVDFMQIALNDSHEHVRKIADDIMQKRRKEFHKLSSTKPSKDIKTEFKELKEEKIKDKNPLIRKDSLIKMELLASEGKIDEEEVVETSRQITHSVPNESQTKCSMDTWKDC